MTEGQFSFMAVLLMIAASSFVGMWVTTGTRWQLAAGLWLFAIWNGAWLEHIRNLVVDELDALQSDNHE